MAGPTHDPADYRERDAIPIRRALVSVSDKTGLVDLATALVAADVEIVSTGSTAQTIRDAGLPVTDVAAVTGYPESLDGRVRTLHPAIHAGLLADLRLEAHETELAAMGIAPFELVISNLYPFVQTVASGAPVNDVIEQIDIGGPALVRASAKNHANVAIVTSPDSYPQVLKALTLGGTTLAQRQRLAGEAFAHTAAYDAAVSEYFAQEVARWSYEERASVPATPAPSELASEENLEITATLAASLRYGENAHQSAALYRVDGVPGIAQAIQHGGKEMSYNNYVDADAALRAAYDHAGPAIAIIKHANPCGIATASTLVEAHARAHACDPVSAFGGVIAANRVVDRETAESIAPIFTEVVVAPGFDADALEVLAAKKNLRVLEVPGGWPTAPGGQTEFRQISGGLLAQEPDAHFAPASEWTLAAGPRVRLARGARGQVERDPPRPRRRLGRGGHGSGEPGRLVPPCGHARRRSCRRFGRRERRVLPLRRRARDPAGGRRACRRAAGRLDPRRGSGGGGAGRGRDDVLHRRTSLLPLAQALR
jgi:phosphoribosylaminoimidazolecarboxamide formyltransferase/IMP cyclohydrolase